VSRNRRSLIKLTVLFSTVGFWSSLAAHDENQTSVTVVIKDFKFAPESIHVRTGDTITFINEDIVPHTATAIDESWDTGNLATGESATITVTEEFELQYFCVYHPMMKAVLVRE